MAEYRTVRMDFWSNPYIESLNAEAKLLYLYLFTNAKTNNLGMLEISPKRIYFESGIAEEVVATTLQKLEKDKKIIRDNNCVWVCNFIKHQTSTSPMIIKGLVNLFPHVPSQKIQKAIYTQYSNINWTSEASFLNEDVRNKEAAHTTQHAVHPSDTLSIGYQKGIPSSTIPSTKQKEEEKRKGESKVKNTFSSQTNANTAPTQMLKTTACVSFVENDSFLPQEFVELRDLYDREAVQEAPQAGLIAFKALCKKKQFPGLGRIAQAILEFEQSDSKWQRGFRPNLERFLREQWWLKKSSIHPHTTPDHTENGKNALAASQRLQKLREQLHVSV